MHEPQEAVLRNMALDSASHPPKRAIQRGLFNSLFHPIIFHAAATPCAIPAAYL